MGRAQIRKTKINHFIFQVGKSAVIVVDLAMADFKIEMIKESIITLQESFARTPTKLIAVSA